MLAEGDDVRIIAGGQTLVPLMAMRLARPRLLIDIARIPDLAYIRREGDFVVIGATTRQCLLEQDPLVRADLPLLAQYYLRRFGGELGREVRELAPEALERLRSYTWPGNIRELQSVLKQALLQASGTILLAAFLPELAGKPSDSPDIAFSKTAPLEGGPFVTVPAKAGKFWSACLKWRRRSTVTVHLRFRSFGVGTL